MTNYFNTIVMQRMMITLMGYLATLSYNLPKDSFAANTMKHRGADASVYITLTHNIQHLHSTDQNSTTKTVQYNQITQCVATVATMKPNKCIVVV